LVNTSIKSKGGDLRLISKEVIEGTDFFKGPVAVKKEEEGKKEVAICG